MIDRDRQRGAILGLAVGDALGAAVEFEPPGTFPEVTGFRGGDDADTTGPVCGQLAGAAFGESGIPEEWRAGLAGREQIEPILQRLLA